jgi:hypothetical protein
VQLAGTKLAENEVWDDNRLLLQSNIAQSPSVYAVIATISGKRTPAKPLQPLKWGGPASQTSF